jgi:hypothetical protein
MSKAIVVLPAAGPPNTLLNALATFPGIVPRIVIDGLGAIVELPDGLAAPLAAFPGIVAVATSAIVNPQFLPLPPVAFPWLAAWNKLFEPSYQQLLATRADQWMTASALCDRVMSATPPPVQDTTLTGDVAIGMLTIDGPAGTPAKLSATDLVDLTLSVLHGLDILYRNAPAAAKLVFMVEPRSITLAVDPTTVPAPFVDPSTATLPDFEVRESRWRDPALAALGLAGSFDGINQYRDQLVARTWPAGTPRKSLVLLLTNYNAVRFGYASSGRVVVQLAPARAAQTIDHLDRVIAHEICHLFNAPDEYGDCTFNTVSGPFGVLNGNCVKSPFPKTACLMAGVSDDLCPWSKAHLGWNPLPFPVPPIL